MDPLPEERPSYDPVDPFVGLPNQRKPMGAVWAPARGREPMARDPHTFGGGKAGFLGDFLRRLLDPFVLSFVVAVLVTSNVATYMYTKSLVQSAEEARQRHETISYSLALANSRFFVEPYSLKGPISWACLNPKVKEEFTIDGRIPVRVDEKDEEEEKRGWVVNAAQVQKLIEAADTRQPNATLCMYGPYCNKVWFQALEEHAVKDQNVLVVGTQWPWLESMCISFGANTVTTVDHNKPRFDHPQMKALSVVDIEQVEGSFDAILSYSSIEHDGLGRYADPIDPDGDLQRMKKMNSLLKPGGKLYLGIPNGEDFLVFNQHRVYGPLRFPMLISGWKRLSTYGVTEEEIYMAKAGQYIQPVHVLTPMVYEH